MGLKGVSRPFASNDAAGLRSIIDHLGPAIFVALTDRDGILLIVNRPAMEIGDLSEEELRELSSLAQEVRARRDNGR